MQTIENIYVRAVGLLTIAICIASSVPAQKKDTAFIISSTDQQYSASPLNLNSNPYYDLIRPDKEGLRPAILYNRDDRFYVGLNYNRFSHTWRKDSTGKKHRIYTNYSINQKAFSVGYQAIFNRAIGSWNLFIDANYDWVKWVNFYGLGNETNQETDDRDYYRMRLREGLASVSLQKKLGKQSTLTVRPFYQYVQVINDEERFLATKFFSNSKSDKYESNNFGGLRADLQLQWLNDVLLPTKGAVLSTGISHTRNLNRAATVTNYSAYTRVFVPFLRHFVLSVENGGAALTGNPEYYQYNSIGGNTLRGYRGERFTAETVFYNNNELQYLFDFDHRIMKARMGVLIFGDQGRVWKKGEQSNEWHYGYGAGVIVVPYRKIYLSIQYGISPERKGLYFEFRRTL